MSTSLTKSELRKKKYEESMQELIKLIILAVFYIDVVFTIALHVPGLRVLNDCMLLFVNRSPFGVIGQQKKLIKREL